MGTAAIAMIVLTALSVAASIGGSIWSNTREQKNYQSAIEYNSPVNQVQRLEEAGLNPNLAAGSSNTVNVSQPSVTNPAESLIGGMQSISQMYNSSESFGLRREQNNLRRDQLELSQIKVDLTKSLVEQQLKQGNIDLALKLLHYDTAMQTQPAEVSEAFARAGLAGNKKSMSDIDLASYQDYRDNVLAQQKSSIAKSDAETFYLENVKPNLEWSRVGVQKMSAEEIQRHNKELERIQRHVAKSNDVERKRQYELAVKRYKLAVDEHDWAKAHYWIEVALSAAGSGARVFGRMKGIPVP